MSETTLVILGASYAGEWPIAAINGYSVINQGIGGNQSFEMLARFQKDIVDSSPNVIIIWGFINDIFGSSPEQMKETKERIKRSYEDMIVEAESHGIQVIVATEVSIREPTGMLNWAAGLVGRAMGKTSYQTVVNRHVSDVNLWLVRTAESRKIPVLDFQKVLADSNGQRKAEYAASDGSHLTSEAYDALSAYTIKSLQSACDSVGSR